MKRSLLGSQELTCSFSLWFLIVSTGSCRSFLGTKPQDCCKKRPEIGGLETTFLQGTKPVDDQFRETSQLELGACSLLPPK